MSLYQQAHSPTDPNRRDVPTYEVRVCVTSEEARRLISFVRIIACTSPLCLSLCTIPAWRYPARAATHLDLESRVIG